MNGSGACGWELKLASLGRGGVSLVARATGLSRPTVYKALEEIDAAPLADGRVRQPGGG